MKNLFPNQESLKFLLVLEIIFWLRYGITTPVLPLFLRKIGFSMTEIGLLMMVGAVGWAIFEPICGILADKINKKWLIIFSFITTSIIFVSFNFASSNSHFYIISFSLSGAAAAGAVSMRAMTTELMPMLDRGKIYGRFMAFVGLGQVIGPFLGGYLTDLLGFNAPFYFCGMIGIIGIVAVIPLKYVNRLEKKPSEHKDIKPISRLLTRAFLSLLLLRLIFIFYGNFQSSTLPVFLNESKNFRASNTQIGFYLTIVQSTSALSYLFLGTLADRVGSKKLIVAGLFGLGLSCVSFILLNGVLSLYLLGPIQGIMIATTEIAMMIYLMTIIPSEISGKAMGMYGFSEDIAGILSFSSLGIIYDNIGPIFSVLTITVVLIFDSVLSIFLI